MMLSVRLSRIVAARVSSMIKKSAMEAQVGILAARRKPRAAKRMSHTELRMVSPKYPAARAERR